jgi:hypothetical protein
MKVVMFLQGQLLDTVEISHHMTKHYINLIVEQLLLKHSEAISKAGEDPVITLEGVPSSINEFTSLVNRYNIKKKGRGEDGEE